MYKINTPVLKVLLHGTFLTHENEKIIKGWRSPTQAAPTFSSNQHLEEIAIE